MFPSQLWTYINQEWKTPATSVSPQLLLDSDSAKGAKKGKVFGFSYSFHFAGICSFLKGFPVSQIGFAPLSSALLIATPPHYEEPTREKFCR